MHRKLLGLKAGMALKDETYKSMARALRARGLEVEESDVLAVVNGRRIADQRFKDAVAAILGKPTFELFT